MSEYFTAIVVPHIIINIVLIMLFYLAISRKFFSRPNWFLFAGIVFMAIATTEKYFLELVKPTLGKVADIKPAILFLEVSLATLGGSLVASAFMSKAQILYSDWKLKQIDVLAKFQGRVSSLNRQLKELRVKQAAIPSEDYNLKLNALLDAIEKLEDKIEVVREELDTDGKL